MSDQSRRKLLKSIAAGSGAIVAGKSLPDSWSRPVVDSVMLPAHAQTSNTGPFAGDADTQSGALDSFISQAHAGENFKPYVCVEANSAGDKATVKLLRDYQGPTLFTFVDVPVGGSSDKYTREYQCNGVDAGDLLRDFGLIKDAHADDGEIRCYVDNVTGVGAGRIEFEYSSNVEFDVGPSACNIPDECVRKVIPLCPPDCDIDL